MSDFEEVSKKKKVLRKITPQRLKNIGLYYLQRFESSVANLRSVLRRRVDDYARANPDFNRRESYEQIEQILEDFERFGYIDDQRYARLKAQSYLSAGKPARYVRIKLQQKGIDSQIIDAVLAEDERDSKETALAFAQKKKIGPFRTDPESRSANRQKDLGTMVRAGFDYDVAKEILTMEEV